MSNTLFTQGEWKFNAVYPHIVENGTVIMHNDQPIENYLIMSTYYNEDGLRCHTPIATVHVVKPLEKQAERNARLLTKAVELFDACGSALTLVVNDIEVRDKIKSLMDYIICGDEQ